MSAPVLSCYPLLSSLLSSPSAPVLSAIQSFCSCPFCYPVLLLPSSLLSSPSAPILSAIQSFCSRPSVPYPQFDLIYIRNVLSNPVCSCPDSSPSSTCSCHSFMCSLGTYSFSLKDSPFPHQSPQCPLPNP
ncbi:hypothetical protein XELAEV_18033305mg [Xenopus laevis]|uniref:Uncharacterized protein n=1 Tax=Xenopus laevis TaxID=8355 RepID=A0A974CK41_XENLA|nr:hypothetical protein XELAEV_18033305mg [Xenopus laevis]